MNQLLRDLVNGDPRALARVITQVENRTNDSSGILQVLFPHTGRAKVIGITGSPGSGKSSLVDRLTVLYRQQERQVGVIAVDPSSPFTGGAILGDRIRMQTFSTDPGVYIRSMASRGHLGGLASATADVVSVMDASGRNPIIVETVGVGQDEIDIVKLADVSIVVLVPGMGDDIQALKAGIMEIADVFVINKADRPGVEKVERAVQMMLSLASKQSEWTPPTVKTIATKGSGIDELFAAIHQCLDYFEHSTVRAERRREAARQRLMSLLEERLLRAALENGLADGELNRLVNDVANRSQDPYAVVEEIMKRTTWHAD